MKTRKMYFIAVSLFILLGLAALTFTVTLQKHIIAGTYQNIGQANDLPIIDQANDLPIIDQANDLPIIDQA